MRCRSEAERRPFTAWLCAAVLLPIAVACGERTTYEGSDLSALPPWAFPTEPQPSSTDFIFLAEANGTVLGRLTEGTWPSWSPDGRRILFHRNNRVRVIDADGTNETSWLRESGPHGRPTAVGSPSSRARG